MIPLLCLIAVLFNCTSADVHSALASISFDPKTVIGIFSVLGVIPLLGACDVFDALRYATEGLGPDVALPTVPCG
jgi:hypothetical protein